jgi:hypothetical protein
MACGALELKQASLLNVPNQSCRIPLIQHPSASRVSRSEGPAFRPAHRGALQFKSQTLPILLSKISECIECLALSGEH